MRLSWAGTPFLLVFCALGLSLIAHVALGKEETADLRPNVIPGVRQMWHLRSSMAKGEAVERGAAATQGKVPRLVTLHEKARIYLMENFLTDEECEHIIYLAKSRMTRSGVVDSSSGGSRLDSIRTSDGTFLNPAEDELVAEIEQRIADWTLLPKENQESLQVLRYAKTQRYGGHYDWFFDKENIRAGGNRHATVLIYLNDVEEGGETTFPNIPAPGGDNGPEFSECARKVLAVKPKKGSAVLFHSSTLEGELEKLSLHEACPVLKGEKWSAPKWIRMRAHNSWAAEPTPAPPKPSAGGCEDLDENCQHWAATGECERNKEFMLGNQYYPGKCIKSCDRCDLASAAPGSQAAAQEQPQAALHADEEPNDEL